MVCVKGLGRTAFKKHHYTNQEGKSVFAKIIDRLALYDLHRKRSKDEHFSAFSLNPIDRDEFYKAKAADVAIMLYESRKPFGRTFQL